MNKNLLIFFTIFAVIFCLDQYIKSIFIGGFRFDGEYISLILVYNKGIAFSMLSFLDGGLKYIQVGLFIFISIYLIYEKDIFRKLFLPIGILYGAGMSNLYDRFIHQGVVDYIFWHKWFNFAVFNFADVMIDFGIIWILFFVYKKEKTHNI